MSLGFFGASKLSFHDTSHLYHELHLPRPACVAKTNRTAFKTLKQHSSTEKDVDHSYGVHNDEDKLSNEPYQAYLTL